MALADICRAPHLVELGKIKIGGKGDERQSRGGGTYRVPRKDDHFTITTMFREQSGDLRLDEDLMASLVKTHGDDDQKLRTIPIILLDDDPDVVLQAAYVIYHGDRCLARSDGKTLWKYNEFGISKSTGKLKVGKELDSPIETAWDARLLDKKLGDAPLFKCHSSLSCVIGAEAARWGGIYKFRTTSQISLDNMYSCLMLIKTLTAGRLRGVPLTMSLTPRRIASHRSTVYVVHIETHGADLVAIQKQCIEMAQMELNAGVEMKRLNAQYTKLLSAPGEDEDVIEVTDLAEEFHPENQAGADVDDLVEECGGEQFCDAVASHFRIGAWKDLASEQPEQWRGLCARYQDLGVQPDAPDDDHVQADDAGTVTPNLTMMEASDGTVD